MTQGENVTVSDFDRSQAEQGRALAAPTKDAGGENFPVGSWLLPKRLRPHIAAFYRFARTADDIADSPDLAQDAKIAGLAAMDKALDCGGDDRVDPIRASIAETGIGFAECRDLLVAFGRDARNQSCDRWADLVDYCRYSAHPVGRYLLLIHDEKPNTLVPGDALCAAFQILNHLQDCGDDWRNLHRLYVPRLWIESAGGVARFFDPCGSGAAAAGAGPLPRRGRPAAGNRVSAARPAALQGAQGRGGGDAVTGLPPVGQASRPRPAPGPRGADQGRFRPRSAARV